MRLENDQQFPTVVARRVGDGEVTIPDDLAESWGVLLFYRGDW
jgi:alkyl hydroperoxide reductase subunit AhpC